jgi:hypothetical protein
MLSRIYAVLLILLVAWSSWAAFGSAGIVVCLTVFAFAGVFAIGSWVAFLILCLVLLGWLLMMPAVQSSREASPRMQCANNMRQIGLAILSYESTYKCFPPAYIADTNGKPMHSWRVLILPFLECRGLYGQYDFNEPWNGPNNKKLLANRPLLYACPSDGVALTPGTPTTSYLAVVGTKAAWRGDKPLGIRNPAPIDHRPDTIMLIETANSTVQWTEPKDFSLDDLATAVQRDSAPVIKGPHMRSNGYFYHDTPGGINVVFVDSHERFLPATNLTPDRLSKLLAIGGCSDDDILPPQEAEELQVNHYNCVVLAVWIVSVVLLLVHAMRVGTARKETA